MFIYVNTELNAANMQLRQEASIRAFPTFHFYKDGRKVEEFTGAVLARLEQRLRFYSAPSPAQVPFAFPPIQPPASVSPPATTVPSIVFPPIPNPTQPASAPSANLSKTFQTALAGLRAKATLQQFADAVQVFGFSNSF